MAAVFNVGSVTSPTSTGNQNFAHGLGTTPTALILFGVGATAATQSGEHHRFMHGFTDGTDEAVSTSSSPSGLATTVTRFSIDDASCVLLLSTSSTPAVLVQASFVSWDATNVTLNWSTVDTTGYVFNWLAIGGGGTQAAIHIEESFYENEVSDVTAIGFQPDAIFSTNPGTPVYFGIGSWNAGVNSDIHAMGRFGMVGFEGGITRMGLYMQHADALATSATLNNWEDDAYGFVDNNGIQATTPDAQGFTMDGKGTSAGDRTSVAHLCLQGVRFRIRKFGTPTSAQSVGYTGYGFQPEALIGFSNDNIWGPRLERSPAAMGVYAAVDGAVRSCWTEDANGVGTTSSSYRSDASNFIWLGTAGGASPTGTEIATLTSLDSDGFTLNWTSAATQQQFTVGALASIPASSGGDRDFSGLSISHELRIS